MVEGGNCINTENIGALISKLRKEKGMTQQELADKLKITDKAVSKWERGAKGGNAPIWHTTLRSKV